MADFVGNLLPKETVSLLRTNRLLMVHLSSVLVGPKNIKFLK